MKDVMLDLETLGTVPGCTILSFGAAPFDEFGVSDAGFYAVVSRASCASVGLHEDPDTLKWWEDKKPEARKVLIEAEASRNTLTRVLADFELWLKDTCPDARVWGNGADFDNPIVSAACRAAERPLPWNPYNGRCYRTVKNQFHDVKMVRMGTHHNALDDARSQAHHLVAICQKRGWRLL